MPSRSMKSSALIWESLARRHREVAKTDELRALALRLGKEPRNAIDHLVRGGYLIPLFKGVYHVSHPEEMRLGVPRHSHLELFALAAEAAGLGPWYFGLETALRLDGLTAEFRREEAVVNGRRLRERGVDLAGHRFVLHRWTPDLLAFGVRREGRLRISDPAKTVLDLAYRDYWSARRGRAPVGDWKTLVDRVDLAALRRYLERFPRYVREIVMPWI